MSGWSESGKMSALIIISHRPCPRFFLRHAFLTLAGEGQPYIPSDRILSHSLKHTIRQQLGLQILLQYTWTTLTVYS